MATFAADMKSVKITAALLMSLFCSVCGLGATSSPEGDSVLKAVVTDAVSGEPLIGAAILIEGTTTGAVTDLDGRCELLLGDGDYRLVVSYVGFSNVPVQVSISGKSVDVSVVRADGMQSADPYPVRLVPGDDGAYSIAMQPDQRMIEDAVVTARKSLESLQALQQERINSAFAIENMGAKEMSVKGISNAQESVAKLSGISIASAGQLIVRGLGDRYSTTTLNGLPIASPNPDNKLIPLDIFPASTIQNITVSKVYEASSFADYSGAHVDISTKEGSENFFTVGFSSGGYFGTVFQDFGRMDSKSLFHTYRINSTADNIAYSQFGQYVRENNIFETSFDSYFTKAIPDLNGNIGYGRSFDVGSHKFNLLASFSIKSGDETVRDAFYRTYEASSSGSMRSEYNYDSYKRKLDIAGLLNLEQTLRESDSISLTAFFARNAENSFLNRHGMDWFESYDLTGHNFITHYYTLQNYQLSGHHENDDHSWLFDWGASASFTSSDEPVRRQVMFCRHSAGDLNFFKLNAQETQRYFGTLDENEFVVSEKNTHIFNDDYTIRFGLTGKYKTRNFDVTRFYYDVDDINDVITDTWDVDRYLGFDAIGSGLVSMDRNKQKRNHYDAFNAIAAAYAEADMQFSEHWFLNAGLRFEASRQSVSYTTDYSTDEVRNIDALDLFPAINLKYSLNDEHSFRMSLSRTVTRPSFVEMAPFLYEETFGGAQIRGNEDLQNGYNYNFDLKYEYFRKNSTDMVGVTAYYKYLDNPIERIQRLAGGAVEHSFNNADSGIAAGVEIEVRKQIVGDLTVSANGSFMYTNVKLPAGSYTNMQRPLQGASPYIVNADITYNPKFDENRELSLALLYNIQGPRIHSVGIMGLGDVKQMAFHSLDFNASYRFHRQWSVSLGFKNMLDQTARYRQDIPNAGRTVDVESWHVGPGFEVGINYTL